MHLGNQFDLASSRSSSPSAAAQAGPEGVSSAPSTLPERLEATVRLFATEIGPRNIYHYENLRQAESCLLARFAEAGYEPERQIYGARGRVFANIEAEITGTERPEEIILIGAHYDTHKDSPGADDNGSALAVLLELAERLRDSRPGRTIRFVAFTNEESPFTHRPSMGSRVYVRACRRRGDKIMGMLCLESLGSFSAKPGSQRGSMGGLVLPPTGDFLAVVANSLSRPLLEQTERVLREEADGFPFKALTAPTHLPLAWSSDHWSFWVEHYPAIMLTDTAPLRHRQYHSKNDTPETLDYVWLGEVCEAVELIVRRLSSTAVALPEPKPSAPLRRVSTYLPALAVLGIVAAAVVTTRMLGGRRR